MESVYCPVSECGTCAGIGEVLTDTGISECMTCQGQGHRRCPAEEIRSELLRLKAFRATAEDPLPLIGLALSLSGLAVVLLVLHIFFGAR